MQRRPIHIHGIPMDIGQNRRGVDMGPSAIRYAGLQARLETLGWSVRDYGNLTIPDSASSDESLPNALNSTAVAAVA